MGETVYQKLLGTPEKAAEFIIKSCRSDCLACPFICAPCSYGEYPISTLPNSMKDSVIKAMLLEWLESEIGG